MDRSTSQAILDKVRQKRAEHPFADALHEMANTQLRQNAMQDVGNLALAGAGVGVGARGLLGLYNMLKRNLVDPKTTHGPAVVELPVPVEDEEKRAGLGDFFSGEGATAKAGIPWYGPAMLFGGMAGLGAGWKGMDALLDARRRADTAAELNDARQNFHDALLAQYARPVQPTGSLRIKKEEKEKAAADLEKVAEALDGLYDDFAAILEKRAELPTFSDAAGALTGGYGMYAGLTGLLSGALIYDKARKRSRQAIIEKALQRRARRQFTQQPTEIFAVPTAVPHRPGEDDNA